MSGKICLGAMGIIWAAACGGCGPSAAIGPTEATSPTTPPAPVRLDLIVFSSNRSGTWAIWSAKPDGSQMKQISKPAAGENDVDAVISPDGASILFTSTRGGTTGLWRMDLDGTKPLRICDGDQGEWSNDVTRIVFRRGGKLFTRDLAAGKEKIISPEGWDKCSGPAWSPDGLEIAFAMLHQAGNVIYIIPAQGALTKEARKVHDAQGACEPHWSPKGSLQTSLVYETESHICTINPDGTKNRLITYYGGVQRYGRFGPDGSKIIFCQAASPEGPWELYVVPTGGGSPAKLTDGGSDMQPDWR